MQGEGHPTQWPLGRVGGEGGVSWVTRTTARWKGNRKDEGVEHKAGKELQVLLSCHN